MIWPLLFLALQAQSGPWEKYQDDEVIGHSLDSETGTRLSVYLENVKRNSDGSFIVWVEGDHSKDATVKHRRSMTRVYFDCRGSTRVYARSTYAADGHTIESWDGIGPITAIRPGTIYQEFEKRLCPAP